MRRITNGEMQTWKRCKRKWWLTYVRRLRLARAETVGVAQLGTDAHTAIEHSYKQGIRAADAWQVIVDNREDPPSEAQLKQDDLVRIMLEGFDDWREETGLDDGYDILAVEHKATTPLVDGVELMGKLDLLVRRRLDGAVLLRDWKTVGSIATGGIRQNEQFKTYALILRLMGQATTGAQRVMLRKVKRTAKAKPPFYGLDDATWTDAQLAVFRMQLIGQVYDVLEAQHKLDTGEDPGMIVYPTPHRDCSWDCDFAGVCPMFDDPHDHPEGLLSLLYVTHDPLERYGEGAHES